MTKPRRVPLIIPLDPDYAPGISRRAFIAMIIAFAVLAAAGISVMTLVNAGIIA